MPKYVYIYLYKYNHVIIWHMVGLGREQTGCHRWVTRLIPHLMAHLARHRMNPRVGEDEGEDEETVSELNQAMRAHKQAMGVSNKMTYLGRSLCR
jgi:hypothetical protein